MPSYVLRSGCRRHRTSVLAVLLHVLAPAALVTGLAGCDRALAPDVQRRLLESAFDPSLDPNPDDYGGHEFMAVEQVLQLLPHSEIVLELDGEWIRFGATAYEFRMIPDTGHWGRVPRGRRLLAAWRLDDPRERLLLSGGDFSAPFGPLMLPDDSPEMFAFRPGVRMRSPDGSRWESARGEALFDPDRQGSECAWTPYPHPVVDTTGRADWLPCQQVDYQVGFGATLRALDGRPGRRTTVRMMPQHVPGIRLTRLCDGSEGAEMFGCGEWWMAPDACVPLNPGKPAWCGERSEHDRLVPPERPTVPARRRPSEERARHEPGG